MASSTIPKEVKIVVWGSLPFWARRMRYHGVPCLDGRIHFIFLACAASQFNLTDVGPLVICRARPCKQRMMQYMKEAGEAALMQGLHASTAISATLLPDVMRRCIC
eukprot:1142710-Pelagomonas_calceolata.AAC.3